MVRRAGLDPHVVVRAAIDLINEEGLSALSLSRLAERLGVKTPSLYKHISGLEGLQRGIALWGLRELAHRMSRAAVGKAGDEAIMAFADAYRRFAKELPGVYTMTVRAPEPGDAELAAASEDVLAVMKAVLVHYGLDADETIHAIRAFRAIVHGFVSLEILGAFGMPLDVEESFHHLVAMLIRGLPRSDR